VGVKTGCGESGVPLKGEKSNDMLSDERRAEDDESQGFRVGMWKFIPTRNQTPIVMQALTS